MHSLGVHTFLLSKIVPYVYTIIVVLELFVCHNKSQVPLNEQLETLTMMVIS